ncbi:CHAT domain-containing protein [Streptomyces sp. NPDC085946]|uniref:CHAT domain-containing protein n=1 Tax=Streptomyces sp. NPDC085946 TaxID=3365744 RepID=UPI0037D76DF4
MTDTTEPASALPAACAALLKASLDEGPAVLFTHDAEALLGRLREAAVQSDTEVLYRAAAALHWHRYAVSSNPGSLRELAGALAMLLATGLQQQGLLEAVLRLCRQRPETQSPAFQHDLMIDLSQVAQEFAASQFLVLALEIGRGLTAVLPPDHPVRLPAATNTVLLRYHLSRAVRNGDALLDEAVRELRLVIADLPQDAPNRRFLFASLADMLRARFERRGKRKDLTEALELAERANELPTEAGGPAGERGSGDPCDPVTPVDAVDEVDPNSGYELAVLGLTLLALAEQSGQLSDHDAAIVHLDAALAATPAGHPERAGRCAGLALALRERHQLAPDPAHLVRAVDLAREARDLLPEHHAERPAVMLTLCHCLQVAFRHGGPRAYLDEAFQTGAEALEALGSEDPRRPTVLSAVALNHQLRFENDAAPDDGDRAVALFREVVETGVDGGVGDDEHAGHLSNLGVALRTRFERTGDLDDLHDAVTAALDAVRASAPGYRRAHRLGQYAGILMARFEHTRAVLDVEHAIDTLTEVLDILPEDDAERTGYLHNRGLAQVARWRVLSDSDALVGALRDLRAAADRGRAERFPDLAAVQSALGGVLRMRFEQLGRIEDLHEAVRVGREAVAEESGDPVARAGRLTNLGTTLHMCFEHGGKSKDLLEAIRVGELAVRLLPPGHPDLGAVLMNLAHARRARFEETGDIRAGAAAVLAYRRACRTSTAPAVVRLQAARSWGATEVLRQEARPAPARRWDRALAGYEEAVGLMPVAAWHGMAYEERGIVLSQVAGTPSAAAAVALRAGQPERAVELLELGRGVLHAQLMDRRSTAEAIRAVAPDLADRMNEVRRRLERAATERSLVLALSPSGEPAAGFGASGVAEGLRRAGALELARTWDALVAEASARPELAGLLSPPQFDALRIAAEQGPVVLLNASVLRSDALIVTREGVRVCELTGVTPAHLRKALVAYTEVVAGMRRFPRLGDRRRTHLSARLRELLAWLWTRVVEPVLDTLRLGHRAEGWPRLWWCPASLLGLLPLHAAQTYDPERGVDTGAVDRVVSAYTPTLRALLEARKRQIPATAPAGRLLVALRHTPELSELPYVTMEAALTRATPEPTEILEDAGARREAVRAGLSRHRHLHFAGHSRQDSSRPGASCLRLHDGPLTVAEICDLELQGTDVAFLSSCEGGASDPDLPDETLDLAGALLIAGYRQVIAAAWAVTDETAPQVVQHIYSHGTPAAGTGEPWVAEALHTAVRAVRDRLPPVEWAGYRYSGV